MQGETLAAGSLIQRHRAEGVPAAAELALGAECDSVSSAIWLSQAESRE